MDETVLEARGVSKFFPGVKALQSVSIDAHRGLDPRAARRERRRQVDADQDRHRPLPSRRGRASPRRQAGRARQPAPRHGARHRRRASGAQPHPALLGGREHHAGAARRSHAAARSTMPASTARRGAGSTCWSSTSIPATPVSQLSRRQDAARRDRQGAVAALARAAARRADRLPDAARDGRAVPPPAASCATTASACSSSATSSRRCRRSATASPCCATGAMPAKAAPMAGLGRQDLVRLMIGRSEQIPHWKPRDH